MADHDVLLLLGSNLDPEKNIAATMDLLRRRFTVTGVSSLIETQPVGMPAGTPNFHNRAVRLRTDLDPAALSETLKAMEETMGRMPEHHGFQSRPIDIDVLMFDDHTDPDVERHYYIAALLAELCPERTHPASRRSLRAIAAALEPSGRTQILRTIAPPEKT